MKQAEYEIAELPSHFLRAIQQTLYQDVCRVANATESITRHGSPPYSSSCSPNEFIFIMQE